MSANFFWTRFWFGLCPFFVNVTPFLHWDIAFFGEVGKTFQFGKPHSLCVLTFK